MEGLFQPAHLFFALLILVMWLGVGGGDGGLRKSIERFRMRMEQNFMAGWRPLYRPRDPRVRCYFPDSDNKQGVAMDNKITSPKRWLKYLAIILLGNLIYFGLMPYLPAGARHRSFRVDAGTLVDLWFCLIVFGIFELVEFLWSRHK